MSATIKDVAARSGVSTATVSRVMSGSVPARPETRGRVRPPSTSARAGLEAMRVTVAATLSHVERRRVAVDEIPGLARREVA